MSFTFHFYSVLIYVNQTASEVQLPPVILCPRRRYEAGVFHSQLTKSLSVQIQKKKILLGLLSMNAIINQMHVKVKVKDKEKQPSDSFASLHVLNIVKYEAVERLWLSSIKLLNV